jgi:Ni/Fe-hydrogenase 1 B-type cytochrome subunit
MNNDTLARHSEPSVFVYEAPVRIWHWINALGITVLALTGYLIASPLPTLSGEPSDHFLMGYIRFAHFSAGYIIGIGFVFRVYWAFAGNINAREIFWHNILKRSYWSELWHEVKWYLFMVDQPRQYDGHNPLAIFMMHWFFVWGIAFMITTGFALYGEGTGPGSWANMLFSSWVIPLFGQSMDVHTWHHFGMWWLIVFIMIHIYVAIREDIMSRQSIISSMISGWRNFKDER